MHESADHHAENNLQAEQQHPQQEATTSAVVQQETTAAVQHDTTTFVPFQPSTVHQEGPSADEAEIASPRPGETHPTAPEQVENRMAGNNVPGHEDAQLTDFTSSVLEAADDDEVSSTTLLDDDSLIELAGEHELEGSGQSASSLGTYMYIFTFKEKNFFL